MIGGGGRRMVKLLSPHSEENLYPLWKLGFGSIHCCNKRRRRGGEKKKGDAESFIQEDSFPPKNLPGDDSAWESSSWRGKDQAESRERERGKGREERESLKWGENTEPASSLSSISNRNSRYSHQREVSPKERLSVEFRELSPNNQTARFWTSLTPQTRPYCHHHHNNQLGPRIVIFCRLHHHHHLIASFRTSSSFLPESLDDMSLWLSDQIIVHSIGKGTVAQSHRNRPTVR